MARVFVSHSGRDAGPAADLRGWLIGVGHEVFLDQDVGDGIVAGEEWEWRLHERLRWADAVVCVVTAGYVGSVWCAAEVGIAQSRGSRLLPVLFEPGVRHPLLAAVQQVDATGDTELARVKLIEALRRVDPAGGSGWPDDRSPFPGLRAFDTDQHRVFFGRRTEVAELAEVLRSPAERAAVLLVVGPSGCGKSSLVRAGVLPVMADEPGWWTVPPILPGPDPVTAMVREIAAAARGLGLGWTMTQVRGRLEDGGLADLADDLLLAAPAPRRRRLLLVVDQFEELLTQAPPSERARFAAMLRSALTGSVRVLATLRPEFLEQLLLSSELTGLPTRTHTLRPLHRDALPVVIQDPARLAGIKIGEDLVARLVADTDTGEALPLLAYTLAQLADGVHRGGQLSTARYQQLGGVQGTLTRQADTALAEAVKRGGRSPDEIIRTLLRLVTVDEQGRPTRRRIHLDQATTALGDLEPFISRRLLITDTTTTDGGGGGVVGVAQVAHEAFLSAWSPLEQAISVHGAALRARRSVEQAATDWDASGRRRDRLWERGQLAAAVNDLNDPAPPSSQSRPTARGRTGRAARPRRWIIRPSQRHKGTMVELSRHARDFLTASIRIDWLRRTRATAILSLLLIAALTAAAFAYTQQQSAEKQQRVATARQLLAQADVIGGSDPRTAESLALAAHRLHPNQQTKAALINHVTGSHLKSTLAGHTDAVLSVAFGPDGHTLATGSSDKSVILWDVTDPTRPTAIGKPAGHTLSLIHI